MNDDDGPPHWTWTALVVSAIVATAVLVALAIFISLAAYQRQSDIKNLETTSECRAVLTADYDAATATLFVTLFGGNGPPARTTVVASVDEMDRLAQLRREPNPCDAMRRAGGPTHVTLPTATTMPGETAPPPPFRPPPPT